MRCLLEVVIFLFIFFLHPDSNCVLTVTFHELDGKAQAIHRALSFDKGPYALPTFPIKISAKSVTDE